MAFCILGIEKHVFNYECGETEGKYKWNKKNQVKITNTKNKESQKLKNKEKEKKKKQNK